MTEYSLIENYSVITTPPVPVITAPGGLDPITQPAANNEKCTLPTNGTVECDSFSDENILSQFIHEIFIHIAKHNEIRRL